tara:strand:+ start:1608 stop:2297 length:690 start_codon:yes stop_codon:yes gene_type:complete
MVRRLLVHIKNLKQAIGWLYFNYRRFQMHLESKGLYSIEFYKIWLWKKDAKYFKVYNNQGDCFFVKLKTKDSVSYESKVLKYIYSIDSGKSGFYPKVIDIGISEFNYLIYENISGKQIAKNSLSSNSLIQIKEILFFLKHNNIVHRDIRPHNIMVKDMEIILLDFEHCVIDGVSHGDDDNLNNDYRPEKGVWDDAYSFKKIIENYCPRSFQDDDSYKEICDMVGQHENV